MHYQSYQTPQTSHESEEWYTNSPAGKMRDSSRTSIGHMKYLSKRDRNSPFAVKYSEFDDPDDPYELPEDRARRIRAMKNVVPIIYPTASKSIGLN